MKTYTPSNKLSIISLLVFLAVFTPFNSTFPFGFIFAGDANGIDVVTHPIGYTGAGGVINVSVGIDPTSANAADMVISTQNVIAIFNAAMSTTGNIILGPLPLGDFDFESVLLHEMGHSLGLSHCNLATESGLPAIDRNYTKSTDGVDNVYGLNPGVDGIKGSKDDVRGDDVNLNYFKKADNNPFTIPSTVDQTTYSRDLADLPAGDNYSTNGDRDVSALLGVPNTESVMQQGSFNAEHQRTLAADDIAGIKYAMAGLDEIAGTADDYTLSLTYTGMNTTSDITIDFDNAQTGFAVSQSSGAFLGGHVAITANSIFFNTGFNWYFNTVALDVCSSSEVDAGNSATICSDETVTLSSLGASITGAISDGVWATSGGDGSFTPNTAFSTATTYTPGTNDVLNGSVILTLTGETPCDALADMVTVTINAIPTAAFTAPADLCLNAGVQAGLGSGTPTGGVYSGAGVTDDGNGMTYSFDPAAAGLGTHTITYTVGVAGCIDAASDDVEVFALPVVTLNTLSDQCIDAGVQVNMAGGSPVGGVYSGPGVSDNGNGLNFNFDPASAGVGVHTLTYTLTDANGCTGSGTDLVEVFALPTVTFTALADLCLNAGVQTGNGGGTPTSGVYSGSGVTDDGNGMTYSFDPAAAGVGTHTLTYTFTDGNSCTNSASDDVQVFAIPTAAFTPPADLCLNAGVQASLGSGTPTGGVYSGAGVTDDGNGMTYSFDPAAAGVGTHTITYTVGVAGCIDAASDDVEVFALPIVTLNTLTDQCIDAGVQVNMAGGSPVGGVYSGPGVSDNGNGLNFNFDPASAGVGVHTLTYTLTDANGCTGSGTDLVEVFALPTVTFTALADLCLNAGVQTGNGGGTPTSGVYSGTGVTDDGNGMTYSFDPAAAGVGTHTLTYTFTDGNSCTNSASDDVQVFAIPTAAFTAPADLCLNAGIQAGLGSGTPTGGVYSGAGVTDDGNGMTYSFDPAAAGLGTHTITYTVGVAGCIDAASDDVEVFALPIVTLNTLSDQCIDAGVQVNMAGGSPVGGVYSGPGVSDNGNGLNFNFDPASAGVGVHTLTYTLTDANGCTGSGTDLVEVFALPTVTFTALADLCLNAGVQTGNGGGTPTSGVYSGSGVTDDGNGMTYSFDPAAAGVGTHTLTYTFTDGNSCTNSASDDVQVFAIPTAAFTPPADLCLNAGVQASLGSGTPTGGVYSGAGVTDDGNGMTYSFDPAAAGVGTHTITYTVGVAGCIDAASDDVEVFALPIVTLNTLTDQCIDAGVQVNMAGGSPVGGVYSGPGVSDNGNGLNFNFDPASAGVGVHTLTYTLTDANGCTGSGTDLVEVFALPTVTFTALADLCLNAGVQTGNGGGTPTSGVYSGTGVTDDGNGMTYSFDPAAAGVGTHTLTYTFTDGNSCTNSASDDAQVFAIPTAAFTAPADLCLNAGIQAGLGSGTPTGGVYSGAGVTDDGNGMTYSFDPAAAGLGTHTITYTVGVAGCIDAASDDVEVFALPIVTLNTLSDQCIDAGVQVNMAGGSPVGGVYSGPGVSDNGNGLNFNFDPASAGVGVHTLTYTLTDANGCTGSGTDLVEVFALPTVTFTALADLCLNAGVQTGNGGGTPTSGVYSGSGVTDDGNGMTYSFDPAAAGVGTHTLTYTFTGGNGCTNSASDDVEVFAVPTVSFPALGNVVIGGGVQTIVGGATPQGGEYSGSGVMDDGNGTSFSFDPSVIGVNNSTTITYSFTDANTCIGQATSTITVVDFDPSLYSIADPCDCTDSRNFINPQDLANSYFYNVLTLGPTSSGLSIALTANGGEALDAAGAALLTDGSVTMTEISAGMYELEFYHRADVSAIFSMTVNGIDTEINSAVCEFTPECLRQIGIPTIGQWGLFILALLMMSLSLSTLLISSRASELS